MGKWALRESADISVMKLELAETAWIEIKKNKLVKSGNVMFPHHYLFRAMCRCVFLSILSSQSVGSPLASGECRGLSPSMALPSRNPAVRLHEGELSTLCVFLLNKISLRSALGHFFFLFSKSKV